MVERSWPWSTVAGLGDGTAELNEALSREFLSLFFGVQNPAVEGVCKGLSIGELLVSGIASPLSVDPGAGICYGLYTNDAIKTLAVTTPSINTTGGRVVLQTNWAGTGGAGLEARTRLAVKMSADGNPAIPGLTQAFGTTWEISLATFTITTGAGVITVTDDRTFRRSTSVVDTDEIVNLAVETGKINNLAVTTGKIANDAVDDTKAGSRVPQFYRRQGGHANNWNISGTTTYTPTAVRMQGGSCLIPVLNGFSKGYLEITFPTAFSAIPIVSATTYDYAGGAVPDRIYTNTITASQVRIYAERTGTVGNDDFYANWLAIGTE
jgi:hypothetical protein